MWNAAPSLRPVRLGVGKSVVGRSRYRVGGMFRQGTTSFLRSVPKIPPEIVCAIRTIACSLGRQLPFFFCREVPVPVYCMSGLVFMRRRSASVSPKE